MEPLPVVIVYRNQPERLVATVDAFMAQDIDVTIAVVDNGSRVVPRDRLPDSVVVIEAGGNTGFGPAANIGFRHFLADTNGGDWIALAPHDALPQPGCLRFMLDV